MATRHDPELEQFKRTIDLVEYAKSAGYEARLDAVGRNLTVLEHANRDRIVVAQHPDGRWIYASVADYARRAPGESDQQARARLRACIDRSEEKGSVVEFVQSRERAAYRREVPLEQVRHRLREFRAMGAALAFETALRSVTDASTRGRSPVASRAGTQGDERVASHEASSQRINPELNRRRYDWTPPTPDRPRQAEVEQRIRRWREADAVVAQRLERASRAHATGPRLAPAPVPGRVAVSSPAAGQGPNERSLEVRGSDRSDLGRRRYDWTPAPAAADGILRGRRPPLADRDR
jgi:hypothetical protein